MALSKLARQRKVTRTLQKALLLFRGGKGWMTYALESEDHMGEETYCALGAISKVGLGHTDYVGDGDTVADEAARLLRDVVRIPRGRGDSVEDDIPNWNDTKKSFRPIREGFCRAIKKSMALERELKKRGKK